MSVPEDELIARARKRIGTTIKGKWRIDDVLGVGGMAAVFRATHRNGSRVALKILHLELSLDADIRRRFLREGYAANAVAHPGVVRVLDDDVTDDGAAFLMMDLLEGESLESASARTGYVLQVDEVLRVTDGVLDVLASAHAKGIVHRDIKPANVFLTLDGAIKVLDFGIAQMRDASQIASFATRAGAMLGTPAFMAPEQALGRTELVDARTDLWAVGATMFLLLSGRPVHEGKTVNEQLVFAATRHAGSLSEIAPYVPPAVAQLVATALAFERDARFPSATAMRDAIRAARGAAASPTAPATQSTPWTTPAAPFVVAANAHTLGAMAGGTTPSRLAPPKPDARARIAAMAGIAALVGVSAIAVIVAIARAHPASTAAARATTTPVSAPPSASSAYVAPAPSADAPADAGIANVDPTPSAPANANANANAAPASSARAQKRPRPATTDGDPRPAPRASSWLDQR